MNILSAILASLPVAEQIALLFIHSGNATHKFQVITGTVNEVAPVVAGVVAATSKQAAQLPLAA